MLKRNKQFQVYSYSKYDRFNSIQKGMSDKLLNALQIQSKITPLLDQSPSKTIKQFQRSNRNVSLSNSEQEISYLQQNDQLFKIINFDNGNPVKDCKALLDMMKQQFLQEKQRLSLFYQPDLCELLQGLKVNDLNLKQTIIKKAGQQIESKIKNIKVIKKNEVFSNYSKLMNFSLSEHQRIEFIKQSSKLAQVRTPSSQSPHDMRSSQTILEKMMEEKRTKIAIQNSSKMNQEQKQLESIMKNRAMCQKILEQSLLFERYYHIMKKEKKKVFEDQQNVCAKAMDTGLKLNRVKTQINDSKYFSQVKAISKRPRTLIRNRTSLPNYRSGSSNNMNDTCVNPRQLRLPQSVNEKSSPYSSNKGYMTEQEYKKQKFMVGLKRDEFLRQIKKVKDDTTEKKNMKNNCLIGHVLELIRQNTIGNRGSNYFDKLNNKQAGQQQSRKGSRNMKAKTEKVRNLSGSELTKLLRRLFLIYSSNNSNSKESFTDICKTLVAKVHKSIAKEKSTQSSQQTFVTQNTLTSQSFNSMPRGSLQRFFRDFNLEIYLSLKNQKIEQILQKDSLDEFEFIQLIHLLSAAMHETQFNLLPENNEGFIYTNINYWISKRILDKKYAHLLQITEQTLLNKLHKDLLRFRKYFRLQELLTNSIQEFIHAQSINKLKVKTIFQDFDFVLEMLWSIKIYPQFINKNTLRFYFEYLKQNKHQFVIPLTNISIKQQQHIIIENIIWLVVANMVLKDQIQLDHGPNQATESRMNKKQQGKSKDQLGNDKNQISKERKIERTFIEKLKLIIKAITGLDQSQNNSSYLNNYSSLETYQEERNFRE